MKRKAETQLESPDPQKKLPSDETQEESTENKEVNEENGENNGEQTEQKEITKETNTSTFPFFSLPKPDFSSNSNFSFFTLSSEQQKSDTSEFKSPFSSFSFPSSSDTPNPFSSFSQGSSFSLFSSSPSTSENGESASTPLFPNFTPTSIESSENNTPTLQQAVNVVTGEEDEDHVFTIKAKVFRFVSPKWRERGQGCLKVNVSKSTKKARIVMRNDKTLQLILNVPLVKECRVKKFGEKDIQLFSVDLSEGLSNPNYSPILIRVKTSSECSELYDSITSKIPEFEERNDEQSNTSNNISSSTESTPVNNSTETTNEAKTSTEQVDDSTNF